MWAAEIRSGKENNEDEARSGPPAIASTKEIIVIDDRRLNINQMINYVSIFCDRTEKILHNEFNLMKVYVNHTVKILLLLQLI